MPASATGVLVKVVFHTTLITSAGIIHHWLVNTKPCMVKSDDEYFFSLSNLLILYFVILWKIAEFQRKEVYMLSFCETSL